MKIRTKFYIVIVPIVLTVIFVVFLGGLSYYRSEYMQEFRGHAESIAVMTAYGLAPALFFNDPQTAEEVLGSARQNSDLIYAMILLAEGKVFSSWEPHTAERAGFSIQASRPISPDGRTMNVRAPVEYQGRRLGELAMGFSLESMYSGLGRFSRTLVLICLGLFINFTLAFVLLEKAVMAPLRQVTKTAREISRGNLSLRSDIRSRDEVGDLSRSFNIMVDNLLKTQDELAQAKALLEERVKDRTRELHGLVDLQERSNQELRLFGELGDAFQLCQTTGEIFAVSKQYGEKIFAGLAGAVYTFNASKSFLERSADWGGMPSEPSFFPPSDCWAIRQSKPHIVRGMGSELICAHAGAAPSAREYLCLPMVAFGETAGLLHLVCSDARHSPAGERHEEFSLEGITLPTAQNFVIRLAMALANFKLREELRQQSIRDALTGLFNRRYMEETLDRELFRAERNGSPLALVMLDLDFFKSFNDTHGHDAGDLVLRELGRLFQSQVRKGDIACRYGGEEFVIILPGAPLPIALERADKLLNSVRSLDLVYKGRPLGRISLSYGLSLFPAHGRNGAELLKAADDALFKAKNEGRDRGFAFGA